MNFLNLEIQLKDIESEIRNKLIDLLSGLRYFKFVTAIVLESGDKKNMVPFIQTQSQKQLLLKATLMMYLNQSILQLCQTYKNL